MEIKSRIITLPVNAFWLLIIPENQRERMLLWYTIVLTFVFLDQIVKLLYPYIKLYLELITIYVIKNYHRYQCYLKDRLKPYNCKFIESDGYIYDNGFGISEKLHHNSVTKSMKKVVVILITHQDV